MDTDKIKILVVMPLYNNVSTVRAVAEGILAVYPDLLVVNDGSSDGSAEKLDGLPLNLISFPENRGKGEALKAAAEWAAENSYSHIISIDADGQHEPSEIPLFIEKIKEDPLSVVVGNRDFSKIEVPGSSRFGRMNSNLWLKVATGTGLPDTQSGFRAYPVEALLRIKCRASRYNYEIEILVRSSWAGLRLVAVDISVKYSEETRRASHFDPLLDNIRCSLTFARLVLRNFLPWPHKILFGPTMGHRIKLFFLKPWSGLKALLRERTSAPEIVLACMLGIFLGTLPFIACHCAVIVFCATRLRLNRLIALNISHLCAPPFVPALCIEAGYFARHGKFLTVFDWHTLGQQIWDRFTDYLLGTLIMAPLLAFLVGFIVYLMIILIRLTGGVVKLGR